MVENILRYNYDITVTERYYMSEKEAAAFIKEEEEKAQSKNHAVIMTGRGKEKESFFDAYAGGEISQNFTWIHFCPQEVLRFDDDVPQEGNFYVMIFEGIVKNIIK